MSDYMGFIILAFSVAIAAFVIYDSSRSRRKDNNPPEIKHLNIPYDDLIVVLETTIETVLRKKYEQLKFDKVAIIRDFDKQWMDLTKEIALSLSDEYFRQISVFHPKKYIISMISRAVRAFLEGYIKENVKRRI